jgi:uncharacterized protein (DUF1697 family)
MARSAEDLEAIVKRVETGKLDRDVRLYVGMLKSAPPREVADAVSRMSNATDILTVEGTEVYWQCRTSFSESTIVGSRLEKALGRPVTFRNVTTMRRLAARLSHIQP